MKDISIKGRPIGAGHSCYLVAEIGINHNGDIKLAKHTIDAAVHAGADAVKFQNYYTEDFITDKSLKYQYISQGETVIESQYEMFKRCELTPDSLKELKEYCDQKEIGFHSTPTSESGIQDLVAVGAPVLKNGSDYLTNVDLIRAMANTGLPTVISTGMATVAEIDDAVRTFRDSGHNQLILLHCTSSYPTPTEEVNLRRIPALAQIFDCPIGFSDHTAGNTAAIGAIVLGACWIEKHFTLDKNLPGPDHRFSADSSEFQSLVEGVRIIEQSLGTSAIVPTASECASREGFRLSCTAARHLPCDYVLTQSDIEFKRPGIGFPPKAVNWLVGGKLKQSVTKGHIFTIEDLR
ncbi:MAG: N-acetylneuraminate synthase family protein [Cyanobacteria bacterium P01_A01_bin.17]